MGRRKSLGLVKDANTDERALIGVMTQRDAQTEDPGFSDLYKIGCAAHVIKIIELADDNFSVTLQGVNRIAMRDLERAEPFNVAKAVTVSSDGASDTELDQLMGNMKNRAHRVIELLSGVPEEAGAMVDGTPEPGQLADRIASNLELAVSEEQEVLETFDRKARVRLVSSFLTREIENRTSPGQRG